MTEVCALVLEMRPDPPPHSAPTFTSFEGYVAARIFVEGLEANQCPFTPDSLATALESLGSVDIGLGGFIGFPASTVPR